MRIKNTTRNLSMSLILELLIIVFGFIVPKAIIDTYGSSVNGLTSTIKQILQILNLLQAGAVGASIVQMYKPVSEGDYGEISLILGSSKRYFKKISLIFLMLVFIIAPIIAINKVGEGITTVEIALSFIVLGLNGAIYLSYITSYDILFSSHQKRYILSLSGVIEKFVYYGLLFAVLKMQIHFTYMYIAVIIGTIAKIIFLYIIYQKSYVKHISPVKRTDKYEIKNKGYLMCNQVATQIVDGTPTVLITMVSNLKSASVYAIYALVQNMIKMVLHTMQTSVSEVFGNLIVSEDEKKISNVYNLIEFVYLIVGFILCTCSIFLFLPFIYLYTNLNTLDTNYMYSIIPIFVVIYTIIYCLYMPCYTLTNVYGLFKETYVQSIVSAITALILSICLGMIHWTYVLIGPIIYYLVSLIFRTYIAKKRMKWINLSTMIRRAIVFISGPIIAYYVSQVFITSYMDSWGTWLIYAIIIGVVSLIFIGLYILIFERRELLQMISYVKILIPKRNSSVND